jgi:hypothetical protein
VAVKVAEVELAGTVTERTVNGSRVLLLDKFTTVPPLGAAWFSVTLQVVPAPEFTLVGLQASEVKVTGADTGGTRLTVADWEMGPATTAEASFEYPLSEPVLSTAVVT